MRHRILKSTIMVCLSIYFLTSCNAQKQESTVGYLEGAVGLFEGDCMPSPGAPPCEAIPYSTTIYVTSPSERFNKEQLVSTIESNKKGCFTVSLRPGEYSLFLLDDGDVICDLMECKIECYCHPVIIQSDSTTKVNLKIDHATW